MILGPLDYSADVEAERGVWIPEWNMVPEEDMHITVALPWWWHTRREGDEELSREMAARFRQTLLMEFHYPFQIELERFVLLGGKVRLGDIFWDWLGNFFGFDVLLNLPRSFDTFLFLICCFLFRVDFNCLLFCYNNIISLDRLFSLQILVALWRCVGERKTEDGTIIYDRHGESIDPFVKLREVPNPCIGLTFISICTLVFFGSSHKGNKFCHALLIIQTTNRNYKIQTRKSFGASQPKASIIDCSPSLINRTGTNSPNHPMKNATTKTPQHATLCFHRLNKKQSTEDTQ